MGRRVARAALIAALCAPAAAALPATPAATHTQTPGPATGPAPGALMAAPLPARVTVALDRPLAAFRPDAALGGGLDGHGQGEIRQIYTPANRRAMASAGLGAITYRLRTELGVEAWHPTSGGHFSDAAHRQGYWLPSASTARRPTATYGYRLPRRGDSSDQANDSGYSRLDDGSEASFWKSNPYLDSHYTHESDSAHPQWALIDLQRARPVDALQVDWYAPYATRFRVQYFTGPSAVLLSGHPPGAWADFPLGPFRGRGGRQLVRIARRPLRVRFVRLLMSASSHTAPPGARDVRDRLGYAIRELRLGVLEPGGRLHDLLHHTPSGTAQTTTFTSSTDPWHRASDRDPSYEQPSFQTVASSGLSGGRPLLVPVSVLYGTPQAAVAELRYLARLRVAIRGVELGEEPDGQLMQPEDYGALYVRFADAIHRAFPHLPLGGPGFQTSIPDWLAWPDTHGDRSWVHRFLDYLRARGALAQLSFFSFEWYPFDNTCDAPAPQLARAAATLDSVLALQRAHGLPASLPSYMTEYGYSAFAGQDEVDLPGALLNADVVARFLSDGGTAAYLYGLEPDALMSELSQCSTWGNLVLFGADDSHRIRRPVAAYWETRMLTRDWVLPGDGRHVLLAGSSTAHDAAGHELVRAYPLRRPDGRLSLLLLNLDPAHAYRVTLAGSSGAASAPLDGPWTQEQLSRAQYGWHPAGAAGHPGPDGPPATAQVAPGTPVDLPPYSLTVETQA
jgi:hypothetical protein